MEDSKTQHLEIFDDPGTLIYYIWAPQVGREVLKNNDVISLFQGHSKEENGSTGGLLSFFNIIFGLKYSLIAGL